MGPGARHDRVADRVDDDSNILVPILVKRTLAALMTVSGVLLLAVRCSAVSDSSAHSRDSATVRRFDWRLPPGFPLPVAVDQPTSTKFELGRRLFYDRRLSLNGSQSCADCHQQHLAFTDGRARAIGSTGQRHTRNSMTLTNAAYNATYTWDDTRVRTLEQQAHIPMSNEHPIELGMRGHEREIIDRLKADATYPAQFAGVFAGERRPLSIRNIARALATFERALISGNSPYDRLVYGGEQGALTPAARRGMTLFFSSKAACSTCHGGFNFSGHTRYAGSHTAPGQLLNNGVTTGRFRVPTLRNIALTAPYMHDGSIDTLETVIGRYTQGRGLPLSCEDASDLAAFLEALTDVDFVTATRFSAPR